jgi:hypothetical protein
MVGIAPVVAVESPHIVGKQFDAVLLSLGKIELKGTLQIIETNKDKKKR